MCKTPVGRSVDAVVEVMNAYGSKPECLAMKSIIALYSRALKVLERPCLLFVKLETRILLEWHKHGNRRLHVEHCATSMIGSLALM